MGIGKSLAKNIGGKAVNLASSGVGETLTADSTAYADKFKAEILKQLFKPAKDAKNQASTTQDPNRNASKYSNFRVADNDQRMSNIPLMVNKQRSQAIAEQRTAVFAAARDNKALVATLSNKIDQMNSKDSKIDQGVILSEKNESKFLRKKTQQDIERKQFYAIIESSFKSISQSTKNISSVYETANRTIQNVKEGATKFAGETKDFATDSYDQLKRSVDYLRAQVKALQESDVSGSSFWLKTLALLGIGAFWWAKVKEHGFLPYIGGLIRDWWNSDYGKKMLRENIEDAYDYISTKIKKWWNDPATLGDSILSGLKVMEKVGGGLLWLSDKLGYLMFGDTWMDTKKWWWVQFNDFMDWYDRWSSDPLKALKEFIMFNLDWIGTTLDWILEKKIPGYSIMRDAIVGWWNEVQSKGGMYGYIYEKIYNVFKSIGVPGYVMDWFDHPSQVIKEELRIQTLEKEKQAAEDKKYNDNRTAVLAAKKINSENIQRRAMFANAAKKEPGLTYREYYKRMKSTQDKREEDESLFGKAKSIISGKAKGNLQPFMKHITSPYKEKDAIRGFRAHGGVDYRAADGETITSVTPGVAEKTQWDGKRGGGGTILVVKNYDGKRVLYMHLKKSLVKEGDMILPGQPIAVSGHSGVNLSGKPYDPHIHIGVKDSGRKTIDPLAYFSSLNITETHNGIIDNIKTGSATIVKNTTSAIKGVGADINNAVNNGVKQSIEVLGKSLDNTNKQMAELMGDTGSSTLMATKAGLNEPGIPDGMI